MKTIQKSHVIRMELVVILAAALLAWRQPNLLLAENARPFTLGQEVAELTVRAAVAEYLIEVDLETLRGSPEALSLELPAGPRVTALRSLGKKRQTGLNWTGRLDLPGRSGEPGTENVFLTAHGEALSGLIFSADEQYQIVPGAGGQHRLAILDSNLFPNCAGEVEVPLPQPSQGDHMDGGPSTSTAAVLEPANRIDVMILYSTAAKNQAGGESPVRAIVQNGLDLTNAAYFNSNVQTRLFLAHMEEVAYQESGVLLFDLNWLSTNASVAALRDLHHADLVALVVASGSGCGISFVQNSPGASFAPHAFQVTVASCVVGNMSLAHEFGHNQGAEHNPEDSSRWPSLGAFPWAYGHYHDAAYRTIMSLDTPCVLGCPRMAYFSNPQVSVDGLPTGVVGAAENFRTLQDTASIVANFRQKPPVIFADDFENGDLLDWSCASASCSE